MKISINEKERELESGTTVLALIKTLGYTRSGCMIMINGRKLLMAQYETTIIQPGDKIVALRLLGGG
jgi:thiamine biosynthesis protein ThiS